MGGSHEASWAFIDGMLPYLFLTFSLIVLFTRWHLFSQRT